MAKNKKIRKPETGFQKSTQNAGISSDSQNIIWVFDAPDRDGEFAFRLDRIEAAGNLHTIFEKMIEYETMTWAALKQQTHDKGKSKHHFLQDIDKLSVSARERIEKLHLEDFSDSIFSFALTNKLRIIGIREGNLFHVKWFDPEHKFYPVKR